MQSNCRIEFNCEQCGKLTSHKASHYNRVKNHFCSRRCRHDWRTGRKNEAQSKAMLGKQLVNHYIVKCDNCKEQLDITEREFNRSQYHFCNAECRKEGMVKIGAYKGEANGNWKNGISLLNNSVRTSVNYEEWRVNCLLRDNYICQCCDKRGGDMEVHHIKTFADILQEHGIDNIEEALECKELWDIENGITLCKDCHKKEHRKLKAA